MLAKALPTKRNLLMSAAHRSIWILLVDGDTTVQQLRALILRLQGYRVDVAGSLDDARAKMAERG